MALGQSLAPVLARAHADGNIHRFNHLTFNALGGVAVLGLCGIAMTNVLGEWVLRVIYGLEFASQAHVFPIIAVAAAIGYLGNILGYVISAAKIFKPQALGFMLVAVVSLVGSIVFIPAYGIEGAAYALVLSSLASFLVPLFLLLKYKERA